MAEVPTAVGSRTPPTAPARGSLPAALAGPVGWWLGLAVTVAVGLAARLWFASYGAATLDADEAVVGLMARRVLAGELPLYFWGQAYLGGLDALLIAPLLGPLGTMGALRWPNVVLPAVAAFLWATLLRRRWGAGAALAAVLVLALPGWAMLLWLVKASAPFGTLAVLGTALLVVGLDAPASARHPPGEREGEGSLRSALGAQHPLGAGAAPPPAWRPFAVGALVGLGMWVQPLFVAFPAALAAVWLLGSAEWAALRARLGLLAPLGAAAMAGLAVAAFFTGACEPRALVAPLGRAAAVLLGLVAAGLALGLVATSPCRRRLLADAGALGLGLAIGTAPAWVGWLAGGPAWSSAIAPSCPTGIPARAAFVFDEVLLPVLGLASPSGLSRFGGTDQVKWALAAVVLLGTLVGFAGAERRTLGRLVALRPLGPCDRLPAAVAVLFLFPIALALLGANVIDAMSGRYLFVTWLAASAPMGVTIVRLWRRVPPLGAAALTLWVVVVGLGTVAWETAVHRDASHVRTMTDVAALERFLGERNVAGGWSDYWAAYNLTLLTDERVVLAPFNRGDRRPAYTERARALPVAAYVLPAGDFPVPPTATRADELADALASHSKGHPLLPWAIEQIRRGRVVDRARIGPWDVWLLAAR